MIVIILLSITMKKKLSRIRIGHTRLTHIFFMKRGEPPICNSCDINLSIKHFFNDCKISEKAKNFYKISHYLTESLGCRPENELRAIQFVLHVNLLNQL